MLEFFAGRANLSRCMRLSGLRTGKFDILYPVNHKGKKRKSNVMNMLSPSGFAPFAWEQIGCWAAFELRLFTESFILLIGASSQGYAWYAFSRGNSRSALRCSR